MKRMLYRLCLAILACLPAGCLNFEDQTMSYRYDKGAEELRIFQDYRGISGGDADGKQGVPLSEEESGQLVSVLEGQRTFFFANWLFEIDVADLEEARGDLKDPEKIKQAGYRAEDIHKLDKFYRLFVENTQIENGPFYFGKAGKLCAAQSVTIAKWPQLVAQINECAPTMMRTVAAEEGTTPGDRTAIAKFLKAEGQPLLEIDGNAMTLRWPMSRGSYDTEFGDEMEDPTRINELRAAGIGIRWADDVMTFALGKTEDEITELTLKFGEETSYTPNAIVPARAAQGIKKDFDPKSAATAFLLREKQ